MKKSVLRAKLEEERKVSEGKNNEKNVNISLENEEKPLNREKTEQKDKKKKDK